MGFGPAVSDQIEQCVGAIAAISDDVPAFETGREEAVPRAGRGLVRRSELVAQATRSRRPEH